MATSNVQGKLYHSDEMIKDFVFEYISYNATPLFVPDSIKFLVFIYCLSNKRKIQDNEIEYKYKLFYKTLNKTKWEIYYLQKYILFRFSQIEDNEIKTHSNKENEQKIFIDGYVRNLYDRYSIIKGDTPYYIMNITSSYYDNTPTMTVHDILIHAVSDHQLRIILTTSTYA